MGRTTAKMFGPDVEIDPPSPIGSATLSLHTSIGNICSATLITPSLILTAAHCARKSDIAMWATKDGGTPGAESHNVVACFIHPKAQAGLTLASCDDVSSTHGFDPNFDMAILRVDSPFTTVSPRSFAPPRTCLGDADGAPGIVRGFAHSSTRRRFRTSAFHRGYQIKLHMPSGTGTDDGDSGGTIEEALMAGRLLGNLSQEGPDILMGFRTAKGPFLWSTRLNSFDTTPQEFLWSVLDPAGNCTLGDSDPCVAIDGTTFPDSDGDGLPDVCDLCPSEPVAGAGCDGQHCDDDGDFVGNECDSFPALCNHDDPDGDGVPSGPGGDPCPMLHASSTTASDIDSDGVPDSCDACPGLDDAAVDPMADEDGDGWADGCDNCPIANPSQSNCNFDMELATSSPILGDACDPSPCPAVRPVASTQIEELSGVEFALINRQIDGPRVAVGSAVEGTLRTGFRWCPCDVTVDSIARRATCALLGCVQGVAEYSDPGSSWKPMSITFPVETVYPEYYPGGGGPFYEIVTGYAPPGTPLFCQEPGGPLTECSRALWGEWDFMFDGTTEGVLVTDGFVERVRGVVWSRAASYATADDDMLPFGCNTSSCSALDGNLNSHYWSGEVRRERGFRWPTPDPGAFIGWAFLPQPICPNCDDRLPLPYLIRKCENGSPCLRFGRVFDPDAQRWRGVDQPLEERVDNLVSDALMDGTLSWLMPAEPAELLGESATRAIAYQTDGRWMRLAVVADDQRLVGHESVQGLMDAIESVSGGRAFLLSGNRHVLVVAGGLVENEPVPYLRQVDLTTGTRATIDLEGAPLGDVWTGTLHASGMKALVLHWLGGALHLTSVDLRTGESVNVVEGIEWSTAWYYHELAALPDGGYALFAQSLYDSAYKLLTFDVTAQGVIERRKASSENGGKGTVWNLRGSSRGLSLMELDVPTPFPFEEMQPAEDGDFDAMF